jgi:hypothetical protein
MSGVSINSARTRDSNGVNDVSTTGARSYFGGSVDFTALVTVLREIPNRSAIRVCGTPSAANLLINAQSSKVITLQVSALTFRPAELLSFQPASTPRSMNLTTHTSGSLDVIQVSVEALVDSVSSVAKERFGVWRLDPGARDRVEAVEREMTTW